MVLGGDGGLGGELWAAPSKLAARWGTQLSPSHTHPMHGVHVPRSLCVNVHSNLAHSRPNVAAPEPPCP